MRSDCPDVPWASQDFYITYGRHVEQQGKFLCHIVRWFYATTNFTRLIDSTTNTKLLPSPAPSELDICETLTITKHSKTQPTSASTYKVRTFFICFFFSLPVIHCFLQPSSIFVSAWFLLHSMPCYFFSVFLSRRFISFSCSTTLAFSAFSSSVLSNCISLSSDAVPQCSLTQFIPEQFCLSEFNL